MNQVDICNRALARLGEIPNLSSINPPEGSVYADQCAAFYPMVLGTLLERHQWTFATKVERLALLAEKHDRWGYAYAKPSDCVRVLSVRSQLGVGVNEDRFQRRYTRGRIGVDPAIDSEYYELCRIGNDVAICTDVEEAFLVYTTNKVDLGKFSPTFIEALTLFLAVDLAGAIIKGNEGMKVAGNFLQLAEMAFQRAVVLDANQKHINRDFVPETLIARGGYGY